MSLSFEDVIEFAEIGRQIEAREQLAVIMDGMAAAGTMQKNGRKKYMRRLSKAAFGPDPERVKKKAAAPTADPAAELAAFGVGFERVKIEP